MRQPYHAGPTSLSVAECDEIALKGKKLYSTGYGPDMPRAARLNDEYDSIVVYTRGMGNHGYIVLRGRTPRARKLVREGKARRLQREHGIPLHVGRICASMDRGMEEDVARLAAALAPHARRAAQVQDVNSRADWRALCELLPADVDVSFALDLSIPRRYAAWRIARRAAGLRVED